MRKKTITLYQFDELSDKAKDNTRDWYRQGALDYEWWEGTYDDAANVGLKITGFDLDRNRHASGQLTMSLIDSITAILKDHGPDCGTAKLAQGYKLTYDDMTQERDKNLNDMTEEEYRDKADDIIEAYEEELDEVTREYERELLEEYSIILQHEYEYLLSDESVDESIRANEYEFDESGNRA